jgi:hypothetical protein
LRKKTEALAEMGAVGATAQEPNEKIEDYEWQKKKLSQPVKEQSALDSKQSVRVFEYSCGRELSDGHPGE